MRRLFEPECIFKQQTELQLTDDILCPQQLFQNEWPDTHNDFRNGKVEGDPESMGDRTYFEKYPFTYIYIYTPLSCYLNQWGHYLHIQTFLENNVYFHKILRYEDKFRCITLKLFIIKIEKNIKKDANRLLNNKKIYTRILYFTKFL